MAWNRRDETQWDEWMKVVDALARRYGIAFARVVESLQGAVTLKELAALLADRGVDAVAERLLQDPTLFHPLTDALQASLVVTTEHILEGMPKQLSVTFNAYNPRAVAAMQAQGGRLVQQVSQGIKDMVREVSAQGLVLGDNPITTARVIRGSIGLTVQQRQAVANYRKLLLNGNPDALERALRDQRYDKTVRAWLDGVRAVDPDKVDDMVARYEQRYIKYRAETIARTEAMNALAVGNRLAWEEVFDAGRLARSGVRRYWHVARDERLCEYCEPIPRMNPNGVAFDQLFQTPKGPCMDPLIHPQCRCVVFVRPVTDGGG